MFPESYFYANDRHVMTAYANLLYLIKDGYDTFSCDANRFANSYSGGYLDTTGAHLDVTGASSLIPESLMMLAVHFDVVLPVREPNNKLYTFRSVLGTDNLMFRISRLGDIPATPGYWIKVLHAKKAEGERPLLTPWVHSYQKRIVLPLAESRVSGLSMYMGIASLLHLATDAGRSVQSEPEDPNRTFWLTLRS